MVVGGFRSVCIDGGNICFLFYIRIYLVFNRNIVDEDFFFKGSILGNCRWRKKINEKFLCKEIIILTIISMDEE